MTREEAREAAEIMLAYANGEEIEALCLDGKYKVTKNPAFNCNVTKYRVKPKSTYRPFKDKDECWNEMLKHLPFGWVSDNYYKSTISVGLNSIFLTLSSEEYSYLEAFHEFRFIDGTPFGIEEK